MARPRKEGMDYFPHDTDATDDEKIDAMRALFGNDGYAFYFILCERIYRTNKAELDLSKNVMLIPLIKKLLVTKEQFEEMLDAALELDLFSREEYESRKVLTSNGIKKRHGEVEKMRKRWRKQKDNPKKTGVFHEDNSEDIHAENSEVTGESKAKQSKVNINNNITAEEGENAFTVFQQNIGIMNPIVSEKISQWIDDLGEPLVIKAIKETALNNKTSFNYTESILRNWFSKGVKTVDEAERMQQEFKANRQSKVTHFPKKPTGKPKLESFKPTGTTGGLSDDEYKKAMELARMLDES